MLFNAGVHVPVKPLLEVVGNAVKVAPEQIGVTAVNDGVAAEPTEIVKVVVAHCPAAGVNVYTVVAKLFNAGDHVPVMPLLEVVGNAANAAPVHIGATAVKVGVIPEVTVTVVVFV